MLFFIFIPKAVGTA